MATAALGDGPRPAQGAAPAVRHKSRIFPGLAAQAGLAAVQQPLPRGVQTMSVAIASGTCPRAVGSPAGFALRRAGRAIWRALQSVGDSRIRRQREALARQCDRSTPTLADRLRESARHSLVD